jgi:hypothetical protein
VHALAAGPAPDAAAVVGHDSSADGGDVLDWLVGTLLPPFGAALFAITEVAAAVASDASDQANGLAASVVAGIPARIPLHNTDLGVDKWPFPTLVPDWTMFGTTPDGILATGTADIQDRDQSTVAMFIDGAGSIEGIQSELADGAAGSYSINLTDLLPDAGRFTWNVTGPGPSAGQITQDHSDSVVPPTSTSPSRSMSIPANTTSRSPSAPPRPAAPTLPNPHRDGQPARPSQGRQKPHHHQVTGRDPVCRLSGSGGSRQRCWWP